MDHNEPKSGVATDVDDALLILVKQGDESALALLYENQSRLVYSLAYSIVRSVPDAEEVTQEVFVRVWQKANAFDRSKGTALAWIVTMTRRLAIDRTRSKHYKSSRRSVPLDVVQESVTNPSGGTVVDPLVSAQASEVIEALNQLDKPYRDVIQLSYFEGLSHSKIAAHLDTPLGTVKTRLRDAVAQLRRLLKAEV